MEAGRSRCAGRMSLHRRGSSNGESGRCPPRSRIPVPRWSGPGWCSPAASRRRTPRRRTVIAMHGGSADVRRTLPAAQHDAPAVALGGAVYVFGGGDGSPSARPHLANRSALGAGDRGRPAARRQQRLERRRVGATAYVVGGYTGTHWLDTSWRSARAAPRGSSLTSPSGVRYAAVAAVGASRRDRRRHAARRIRLARRLSLRLRAPRASRRIALAAGRRRRTRPRLRWAARPS